MRGHDPELPNWLPAIEPLERTATAADDGVSCIGGKYTRQGQDALMSLQSGYSFRIVEQLATAFGRCASLQETLSVERSARWNAEQLQRTRDEIRRATW